MSHIITLIVPNDEGPIQLIFSDGLNLSRTKRALSAALEGVQEQEIRERIRAEQAAQDPDAPEEASQPPVLDG
jgi:hypothetical protein